LDKLVHDLYNVVVWHLLIFLPQWCFALPPCGGVIGHNETCIQLKHFLTSDWENLQEKFFLQAQALLANSNTIPFLQHDPPTHKHMLRNLTLGRVEEYSQAVHALAPFSLAPTSSDTTSFFIALHPESDGYFPLFLENYEQD
jgi:hypothetical protein